MSSRRVAFTAASFVAAMSFTAACDSPGDDNPNEDGHFYCADANGNVVDEDRCDDTSSNYDSGLYFFYMGSSVHTHNYPVGTKLPPKAQKFSVTDKAARTRFGLPTTGRVSNGTVKTGVVGKGGPGSSAKVGSGGGSGKGGSVGGGRGSSGG